jgi:hypothetical protein
MELEEIKGKSREEIVNLVNKIEGGYIDDICEMRSYIKELEDKIRELEIKVKVKEDTISELKWRMHAE